ncbi:hypothetical protein KSP39_PZI021047 [Platanthera zijinensis]|uniref:SAUR family protein n=1 Tax=Platanthera zijinensis TaxID=2320716 RepID=A0AAP0AWY5_9ASPA
MEDSGSSSNKIMDVVRLRQMLKRWRKRSSKNSIKLLKKTFSFSETSSSSSSPHCGVPKGCFAVCVGEEMQRFVVPMEYLRHRAFQLLLREAEEEFGFQNEGVLRIPCEISVFEGVLQKLVEEEEEKKKTAGLRRHCSSEAGRNQLLHLRGQMYG